MPWWMRNGALGNSEGLMVALVLGAVLAHLARPPRAGRSRSASAPALLRPEAWPFLGLYALWLLYEDRAPAAVDRRAAWRRCRCSGSGPSCGARATPSARRTARRSPNPDSPAFADNPALEVVENAIDDGRPPPAVVGAVLARRPRCSPRRAPAPRRRARDRDRARSSLAAAWIGLVAVMTVRGFCGNQRYLIVPAALLIVARRRRASCWAVARGCSRGARARRRPSSAAAALALVGAVRRCPTPTRLRRHAARHRVPGRARTTTSSTLVDDAGGAERLQARAATRTPGPFLVPQVAWRLHLHINEVDLEPEPPAVVFHVSARSSARGATRPACAPARPHVLARARRLDR